VIQGARYERQSGGDFDAYVFDPIRTIADHLHWKGADPWAANLHSNAYGGGHAHCGALVYLGGAFPPAWRGRVLMNNIHGNRTNADVLARAGSGFIGSHGEDLLVANDRWFRGVALEAAPDGSVYATDWYDQQACHLTDPLRWDRSNGRIYRVAYGPKPTAPAGALDLAARSSAELVALQASSNEWLVRHARRILQERGPDPAVRGALRDLMDARDEEAVRLRALWALHAVDGLGDDLPTLLRDRDEAVQAWAVQLLLERKRVAPAVPRGDGGPRAEDEVPARAPLPRRRAAAAARGGPLDPRGAPARARRGRRRPEPSRGWPGTGSRRSSPPIPRARSRWRRAAASRPSRGTPSAARPRSRRSSTRSRRRSRARSPSSTRAWRSRRPPRRSRTSATSPRPRRGSACSLCGWRTPTRPSPTSRARSRGSSARRRACRRCGGRSRTPTRIPRRGARRSTRWRARRTRSPCRRSSRCSTSARCAGRRCGRSRRTSPAPSPSRSSRATPGSRRRSGGTR
jgi:hypothetical protein